MLKVNPDIASKKINDDTVLLNIRSGDYFVLNDIGGFIWERIKSGIAEESALNSALIEEYDIAAETATADINELLEELRKNKILC